MALAPFFSVAALAQAPDAPGPFTEDVFPALRPILTNAVSQSPAAIEARINITQAEIVVEQRFASFLPTLSVNSSYYSSRSATADTQNIFGNTGPPSTSSGFGYGASLSQTIFQFGALKNAFTSAKLGLDNSRLSAAERYRALVLYLRSEYLGLIQKKTALANARFDSEVAGRALAEAQNRLAASAATNAEVAGPEIADIQAKLAVEEAEHVYATAKRLFARMSGLPAIADAAIPDSIPKVTVPAAPPSQTAATAEGPAATFQGRILANTVKQGDLSYKVARAGYWPTFSVSASYSLGTTDSVANNSVTRSGVVSNSVSLGMNWTIFNGFSNRAAVRSSLASKRSNEIQLRSYIESTNEQLTTLRQTLVLTGKALALAERQLDLAQTSTTITRTQSQNAATGVSRRNVDLSESSLHGATLSAFGARATYLRNAAEYYSLAGADPALRNLPPEFVPANGR